VLRRCACVTLVFGCRLGGAADLVVNHVNLNSNIEIVFQEEEAAVQLSIK
jgi:hypothetical protein